VGEQAGGQPLGGLRAGTEVGWRAAVEDGRDGLLRQAGCSCASDVRVDLKPGAPVRADSANDSLADLLAETEGRDLAGPLTYPAGDPRHANQRVERPDKAIVISLCDVSSVLGLGHDEAGQHLVHLALLRVELLWREEREAPPRLAMERVRQLTPRNWGFTLSACIARINAWLRGWHGFFGIASVSEMQMMRKLDAHIRRRLRAILRHWKRKRTIVRNLIALGVNRRAAWKGVYSGHKSWWALSHCYPVDQGLRTRYFTGRGLLLLVDFHRRVSQEIVATAHQQLTLEWG
jgi:hypothetical protein